MEWFNRFVDAIFKDPNLVLAFFVGAAASWVIALKTHEAFRRLAKDLREVLERKIDFLSEEVREREIREARLLARIKELESAPEKGHVQASPGPGSGTGPKPGTITKRLGWEQVTRSLRKSGIPEQNVEDLKSAILDREIGLHDSDGRLRVRLWDQGTKRTPVAILWRGSQNYRVLSPDGSDNIVPVADLREVDTDKITL